MNKYTLGLIIIVLFLLLSLADANMPLVTMKIPLSKGVIIKLSLYDNSHGYTKMFIENLKSMMECLKAYNEAKK